MKTLRSFQLENVNKADDSVGLLIADECGLGKTISGLEIAKTSRKKHSPNDFPWRCLIVCPPKLVEQWIDAICDQDPEMIGKIHVTSRLPYDYIKISGYVIHTYYDLLDSGTLGRLSSVIWDCTIVDEAHRIKNRKTKWTQAIKHIPSARKVCLSGTPQEKGAQDLWSILNYLDSFSFPSYWGWVMKWLNVTAGYHEKYKVGSPKDPTAFASMLKPYMIRHTKQEVMPELPERIIIEQHVAMEPKQQELYNTLKHNTDIEARLMDQTLLIPNTLAMMMRLMQLSSFPGTLGFNDVPSGKIKWLDEFLEDNPDDATTIFTRFRPTAERIADIYGCELIMGGEHRQPSSTGRRLLVGTIDSVGEGLNLQWAKNAICIDIHPSARAMTQTMDRIHRMDIKEAKNIYLLWSCREDRLAIKSVNEKWTEAELVYHYLHEAE